MAENSVVTFLEEIHRKRFDDPELTRVQEEAIQAVRSDPEKFFAQYDALPRSFGGRYVCTDLCKEPLIQSFLSCCKKLNTLTTNKSE